MKISIINLVKFFRFLHFLEKYLKNCEILQKNIVEGNFLMYNYKKHIFVFLSIYILIYMQKL